MSKNKIMFGVVEKACKVLEIGDKLNLINEIIGYTIGRKIYCILSVKIGNVKLYTKELSEEELKVGEIITFDIPLPVYSDEYTIGDEYLSSSKFITRIECKLLVGLSKIEITTEEIIVEICHCKKILSKH